MTKIAINGTSKGLGKYILENFSLEGYEIVALEGRIQNPYYVKQFTDIDIFINNANENFHQVELFYKVFQKWQKDSSKHIINIGSRAAKPNISVGYMYSAQKAALSHLTDNLVYNNPQKKCKITTINLGLLESDRINPIPCLNYEDVLDCLQWIISLPAHLEIPDITLQNSENYKKVQKDKARKV